MSVPPLPVPDATAHSQRWSPHQGGRERDEGMLRGSKQAGATQEVAELRFGRDGQGALDHLTAASLLKEQSESGRHYSKAWRYRRLPRPGVPLSIANKPNQRRQTCRYEGVVLPSPTLTPETLVVPPPLPSQYSMLVFLLGAGVCTSSHCRAPIFSHAHTQAYTHVRSIGGAISCLRGHSSLGGALNALKFQWIPSQSCSCKEGNAL